MNGWEHGGDVGLQIDARCCLTFLNLVMGLVEHHPILEYSLLSLSLYVCSYFL
jgi:hypothetical protein